jgi:hypothetical protein
VLDNRCSIVPQNPGAFDSFQTPLPRSLSSWKKRRTELRGKLWGLLGDLPELFTPKAAIQQKLTKEGYTLERFTFDNGIGVTVYGYLMVPSRRKGPHPAILYHHQHAGNYTRGKKEIITRAHPKLDFATGEALVRRGYVVLCIDAYAFGQRRFQGPAGRNEQGAQTEASLFKMFLWQGRTLWGMMVRDDLLALNYLLSRPEVDPKRIADQGRRLCSVSDAIPEPHRAWPGESARDLLLRTEHAERDDRRGVGDRANRTAATADADRRQR